MFISDTKAHKSYITKVGFIYLMISLFCVLFGAVYEYFSHAVYSNYMIYAFVFPLAGGALPFAAMSIYDCKLMPGRLPMNLYNAGIAALTVGSVMEGVLEIYGTTNDMLQVYWVVGAGFAGMGLLLYAFGYVKSRRDQRQGERSL